MSLGIGTSLLLQGAATQNTVNALQNRILTVSRLARRTRIRDNERIRDLENDVAVLAMMVRAMMDLLAEKQLLKPAEFQSCLKRTDLMDGIEDGKLKPRVALGEDPDPQPRPRSRPRPRYRSRTRRRRRRS